MGSQAGEAAAAPGHKHRKTALERLPEIGIGLYIAVVAVIGVSFLVGGIELHAHAVRTSAAIVAVKPIHYRPFGQSPDEFTLRFTDRHGRQVTEQTEQILQASPVPRAGDHVEIYYAAGDPANVSDVRFGSPGDYNFFMSAMCGGLLAAGALLIVAVRIVRSRRAARRRTRNQGIGADQDHRGAERDVAKSGPRRRVTGGDDPSFVPGFGHKAQRRSRTGKQRALGDTGQPGTPGIHPATPPRAASQDHRRRPATGSGG